MGRAAFSPGSSWGESVSLLIEVANKIQEHVVVGLRFQVPRWLLAGATLSPWRCLSGLTQSYLHLCQQWDDGSFLRRCLFDHPPFPSYSTFQDSCSSDCPFPPTKIIQIMWEHLSISMSTTLITSGKSLVSCEITYSEGLGTDQCWGLLFCLPHSQLRIIWKPLAYRWSKYFSDRTTPHNASGRFLSFFFESHLKLKLISMTGLISCSHK